MQNFKLLSQLLGRIYFLSLVVAVSLSLPSSSQARLGGNFGAGLIVGKPTGLSGKLWLNETNALDFILGINTINNALSLNADYLWHDFGLFRIPSGQLPLYYGMGIWAAGHNHGGMGLRGVVGIEYLFPSAPLDAFFEIGPGMSVLPETSPVIDAGLGMRYFF